MVTLTTLIYLLKFSFIQISWRFKFEHEQFGFVLRYDFGHKPRAYPLTLLWISNKKLIHLFSGGMQSGPQVRFGVNQPLNSEKRL